MNSEDELAESLRSTLLVSMADAAGIRLAPNGEGGLTAALEVQTKDGAWRFVLPRTVCLTLLSECSALAAMTPEQAHALAAELNRGLLEERQADSGDK